jgi:formylglycine-generating enzyme required for sulfatase activity
LQVAPSGWDRMCIIPRNGQRTASRSMASGSIGTLSLNADLAAFIAATGYVTFAERPLDPALYPGAQPDLLKPGSAVFSMPGRPVRPRNMQDWWKYVPGADWRHPEGPGSTIAGRASEPVVHIAFEDAAAYAAWTGKDLPTEAEWGVCRARRAGRRRLWLGQRTHAGRAVDGQYLAGRVPLAEPRAGRVSEARAGRLVSRQWLRPVRIWPTNVFAGPISNEP